MDPEMRCAFVLPIGVTLGGSNIWSARMCGHLAARGVPTALLEHANPGWHPDSELPVPSATPRIRCGGKAVTEASDRDVEGYARAYARALPAVFVPNWSDAAYATCALLSGRYPGATRVVGVAHGNAESYYGMLTYYEPVIDAYVAVSDEISAELKRRLAHRASDVETRACPVDVPKHLLRAPRNATKPIVLTYAGRITNHEKRVSNLRPLLLALGARDVDFRFRIIGDGGYKRTLEQEILSLPPAIRDRVSVEGMLPANDMPGVWRASDVCILVSDSEGTSVSMLEAMAEGCVPVVTRVSGTAAVIADGRNGVTVAVGDMEGMAAVLAHLARNRAELDRMSAAAHRTALERYSYRDYVPWFIALCDRIHRGAPRTWPPNKPLIRPASGARRSPLLRAVGRLMGRR
jgi:glycosyltransferase involved in cell wall biosynthesis